MPRKYPDASVDGQPSDLLQGVQFITPPTCRDRTWGKASFLELPSLETSGNKKSGFMGQKKDDNWWLAGRGAWQPRRSCTFLPLTLKVWATKAWFLLQEKATVHFKAKDIHQHKCCQSANIFSIPAHTSLPPHLPRGKTTFPDFTRWFSIFPLKYCFYKTVFSCFQYLIACLQRHHSTIMAGGWEYFPQTQAVRGLGGLAGVTHPSAGTATALFPNGSWPSDTSYKI